MFQANLTSPTGHQMGQHTPFVCGLESMKNSYLPFAPIAIRHACVHRNVHCDSDNRKLLGSATSWANVVGDRNPVAMIQGRSWGNGRSLNSRFHDYFWISCTRSQIRTSPDRMTPAPPATSELPSGLKRRALILGKSTGRDASCFQLSVDQRRTV